MLPEKINSEIKISDLLTSFSILLSLSALLIAWAKDRNIRKREQADRVRNAAAKILAKLERWRELNIWFFRAAQPSFVETSKMLVDDFNITSARDYLWNELNKVRLETQEKILNEQIETSYIELYSYHPKVHDLFVDTLNSLKQKEIDSFDKLLTLTQDQVIYFRDHRDNFTTDALGNSLRKICYEHAQEFKIQINDAIKPIHTYLYKLISLSDSEVLKRDKVLIPKN